MLSPKILVLALLAIATLPACSVLKNYEDPSETVSAEMPPAPLPDFREGDFFQFDNGVTYRVIDVNQRTVTWGIGESFRFETLRNMFYPWTKWESPKSSGIAQTNDPELLWPLVSGKSEFLLVKHTFNKNKGGNELKYTESRNCSVLGTVQVNVPAGKFDTYKVKCSSQVEHTAYMGTTYYYYAPEVGHFVKEITFNGAFSKSAEKNLTGFGISLAALDKNDRDSFDRTFQKILSTTSSGTSSDWSSQDQKANIRTTPTGTFVLEDNRICRNYDQLVQIDGRTRKITGRACRSDKGQWIAP